MGKKEKEREDSAGERMKVRKGTEGVHHMRVMCFLHHSSWEITSGLDRDCFKILFLFVCFFLFTKGY